MTPSKLSTKDALATVPVKDLARAKTFYEQTLGLEPVETEESGVQAYRAGSSTILVYQSDFAGTNQATAVTWPVGDDLDSIVADLKAKGVAFEHYSMPGTTLEGDIHVSGHLRVSWFRDPDGNIINVGNY